MSPSPKQTGRRAARREALFVLYQWDLTGRPVESQPDEIDPFARELAETVVGREPELDRRIDEVSEGWPADRLGVLERNILRIGIAELEGDCRGSCAGEAIRVPGGREARQRDPGARGRGAGRVSEQADPLDRAAELLDQLEVARARLEQTEDPDTAVELLTEITELAKEAHAEIERARREADAQS